MSSTPAVRRRNRGNRKHEHDEGRSDPGVCSPVWATVEGVERATDDPADHSPERSRDPRRLLGVPGARGSARGSSSRWPRTRGRGQRRGADPSSGGLGPQRLGYGQRDDVWSPSVARSFHTARIGASATWSPRRSRRTAQRRRRRRRAKSIPTSRNLPSSLDASDPDGFSFLRQHPRCGSSLAALRFGAPAGTWLLDEGGCAAPVGPLPPIRRIRADSRR